MLTECQEHAHAKITRPGDRTRVATTTPPRPLKKNSIENLFWNIKMI